MTTTPYPIHPNQRLNASLEGKSLICNGGFENWSRGDGTFVTVLSQAADHWFVYGNASVDRVYPTSTPPSRTGTGGALVAGTGVGGGGVFQPFNSWNPKTDPLMVGKVWSELEGQRVTFSAWVFTASAGAVKLRIGDYKTSRSWAYGDSAFHTGSGWELLTAFKDIDTDLDVDPALLCGVAFFVDVANGAGCVVDTTVAALGWYPDGLEYVPGNEPFFEQVRDVEWAQVGAAPLSAFTPVSVSPTTGLLVLADPTVLALSVGGVAGILLRDGAVGETVPYVRNGYISNPFPLPPTSTRGWGFSPGLVVIPNVAGPLWLKTGGVGVGATWSQKIGITGPKTRAVGPTTQIIQVSLGEILIL